MEKMQRSAVIDASHTLLDEGLVVRTWGNVSHRTQDTAFVITPSGRSYTSMIEADLAAVDPDGVTSGPFKASGEYPMHRLCYKHRPDAQMVVHTHQPYASALSQLGRDLKLTHEEAQRIGQPVIRIAPYGLPSTKQLHKSVEKTLSAHPEDNVVLLEAHGVFLCGDSPEHAIQLARDVEQAARRIYQEVTGSELSDPAAEPHAVVESRREQDGSISAVEASGQTTDLSAQQRHQHERIYAQRKNVHVIRVCRDSEVEALRPGVDAGQPLRPYLDDFAQIVGVKADHSTHHNVVFSEEQVLCLGADSADAAAVESVLKKNARAARIAQLSGNKPIVGWECLLMNAVYRLKYSRQAG